MDPGVTADFSRAGTQNFMAGGQTIAGGGTMMGGAAQFNARGTL
jgi:hypothetical protein